MKCQRIPRYVSAYLHMCPHTSIYVSFYIYARAYDVSAHAPGGCESLENFVVVLSRKYERHLTFDRRCEG